MKRIRLVTFFVLIVCLFCSTHPSFANDSIPFLCTEASCTNEEPYNQDSGQTEKQIPPSPSEEIITIPETSDEEILDVRDEPTHEEPEPSTAKDPSVDTEPKVVEESEVPIFSEENVTPEQQTNLPSERSELDAGDNPTGDAKGLIGLSLLNQITLSGTYEGNVTLTLRGRGVLNLNLLKDRYVIFKLPTWLMPYVDRTSFRGMYDVPNRIGSTRNTGTISSTEWEVNDQTGQVQFRANQLLSFSLITPSDYVFQLSFRLNSLPLGHPQTYTFYGHMTNEIVHIELISDGQDRWVLQLDGPLFTLSVPPTIDFGTIQYSPGMARVYRPSKMRLGIFHERANGYPWRLIAKASSLTASNAPPLRDTVYFRKLDGTILSLEQGAQFIASGIMSEVETELIYESNEGVFIDMTSQIPESTRYSTTIEWTLVNAL